MQSLSAHWQPSATVVSSTPSPAWESARTSGGAAVSVLPAVVSFFSSLSPNYALPDKRHSSCFITAARAAPADQNQSASEVIDKVKLACNILSSWVPTARVVSDAVATLCSSFSVLQDLGTALAPRGAAGTVAAFTVVALDNIASAGAAKPAPGQRGSPEQPILIDDSKTLSRIGQDDYPTDAFYRQTASFSHRITEPGPSFSGYYDGGCHTISDLQTCLFRDLDRYSEVRNLRLQHVTIDADQDTVAALACSMESFAKARDIRVENATIHNHGSGHLLQPSATGMVVGHQHQAAQLADISLSGCSVNTTGDYAVAGGVAALADGQLHRAVVAHSHVTTYGPESHAGLGAGMLKGQINDLALIESQVSTHGDLSHTGGGAGIVLGDIRRIGASRCQVNTSGRFAAGGIGAGGLLGNVSQLSGVECLVATSGRRSRTGLGAGQVGVVLTDTKSRLSDLVIIDSKAIASGDSAVAGVGAGAVHKYLDRLTSVRCQVTAVGKAGVGTGMNLGWIDRLTSVNDTVTSITDTTGIAAGNNNSRYVTNVVSWNSRLKGVLRNIGTPALTDPCQRAEPLFIQPNCTATPSPLDGLQQSCMGTYAFPHRGTALRPIEVDSAETLNRIGLDSDYPASAHYVQTREIDGSKLSNDGSVIFSGHYDGQHNVIRAPTACLFNNLFGTVRNLHLVDARIHSDRPAAVVACEMDGAGGIEGIVIDHCQVSTTGAPAGIICGRQKSDHNKVRLIDIHHSAVHSEGAEAGMVAGQCRGLIERVTVGSSRANTTGRQSHAGLGCGEIEGVLRNFSATCSQVETSGPVAMSGVGVGTALYSRIGPATIVNCNLSTSGQGADAGLAAGYLRWRSEVNNITMVDSRVLARRANAGTGVGTMGVFAKARGVTAVRCEVLTEADGTHAGIGTGISKGSFYALADVTSVNNTLSAPGRNSHARVPGSFTNGNPVSATGTRIANTRINGQLHNNTLDQNIGSTLCAGADSRFVTQTCQVEGSALAGSCPLPPMTIAAPTPLLATGLSAGAVAAIALGSVLVLGAALAGYCYYRRQHQSANPNGMPFQRFGQYEDDSFSADSI